MAKRKVTLRVFGMTCDDCVKHVSEELKNAGATEVLVSLKEGSATAVVDDTKTRPEDIPRLPVFGNQSRYRAQLRKVE